VKSRDKIRNKKKQNHKEEIKKRIDLSPDDF
jgi:hypothetical protein